RLGLSGSQISEERRVVDEIERRIGIRRVNYFETGERDEVARLPLDGAVGGLGASGAGDDVEELAAGVRSAGQFFTGADADEAGQEAGTCGWIGSLELGAQVERDEAALACGIEFGGEGLDGNAGCGAGFDRIGGF